ncbi:MAG: LuxR C-terminal-related transcriptional regulator [Chloroflexota bacterium]
MSAATNPTNPVLLLQTKLFRPQVHSDLVQRPHLIHCLNHGLRRKLTLVAAPAGYGKTTIVTQWLHTLQTQPYQVAWFSLDESDNDLPFFLHYLVSAIQQTLPNSCPNTLAALRNPRPLPWSQLVTLLLNDLATIAEPLILVLDDYHLVTDETIHHFLDRLLDHLPPAHHLVLISRTEPPLSLPRLRVRQQLNELRTADLSFSNAEIAQYLTRDSSKAVAPETIAALQAKSQGWVASLYLAKLSLDQNPNEQTLLQQLQASNVHIMDYLLTEVFNQQPRIVQTFLLQTSILRRFCYPLCEALLGATCQETIETDEIPLGDSRTPIQNIIDRLARQNLFVVPLDKNDEWYRYHDLFQLMLTRRMEKEISASEISALHKNASRWFATVGFIDDALHHALAADDIPFAVQLIEQHRLQQLEHFDAQTLERWLSKLPKGTIEQHPNLLLAQFWINFRSMRYTTDFCFARAQQVEKCLKDSIPTLDESSQAIIRAEIAAIRLLGHFWRGEHQQVLDCYQQVITTLPQPYLSIRVQSGLYAVFALQAQGKTDEAIRTIQRELQTFPTATSPQLSWFKSHLLFIYYIAGNLQQAQQVGQELFKGLQERGNCNPYVLSTIAYGLGLLHYEGNDLDSARFYFSQIDQVHSLYYYQSRIRLAWLHETADHAQTAQQIVDELRAWVSSADKKGQILDEVASFQARRLAWQGNAEQALGIMRDVKINKRIRATMAEKPALTLARALITHPQKENWHKAERLLDELWANIVKKGENIPCQVEILALKALLHQQQTQLDQAVSMLERAVKMAKRGSFMRTFVDLGKPMATLLDQLLEHGVESDYVGRILAAFPQVQPNEPLRQQVQQATQTQLVEPLTRRETDVLLLLNQELSNKKIAQRLTISPLTVKRHTINIYQKLSVSGRHEAVRAARSLGILSQAA